MRSEPNDYAQRKARARRYFLFATAMMFLLAFVWSLDASFVYLLLGAAVYFAYLGYWSLPRALGTAPPRPPAGGATFEELVQRMSREKSKRPAPAAPSKGRQLAVILPVFAFCIFLVVMLATFLPSGDTQEQSPFSLAEYYLATGEYESARTNYRLELTANPDNTAAMVGLGKTYASMGQVDSALYQYNLALNLSDTLTEPRYQKAWLLYQQKSYSDAALELTRLLDQHPQYLDGMLLLGNVYYDQEQLDHAFRWYDRAYNEGLRGSWLCHVLGYLNQTRGNNTRAIALYQEALSYDSSIVDIYQRLGQLVPGPEGDYYRQRGAEAQ